MINIGNTREAAMWIQYGDTCPPCMRVELDTVLTWSPMAQLMYRGSPMLDSSPVLLSVEEYHSECDILYHISLYSSYAPSLFNDARCADCTRPLGGKYVDRDR